MNIASVDDLAEALSNPSRRKLLGLGLGLSAAVFEGAAAFAQTPDETPITRPIPYSGEMLPVVGLGTAINFNPTPEAKASYLAVLQSLVAGGGTLIDTASTYGDMEVILGDLIAQAGLRSKVFLATKIEATEQTAGAPEFLRSLKRLQTGTVDLLQLHNVSDPKQSMAMFRAFKGQGLCRYIGVTSTFPNDYAAMEAVVRREKPDFMQVAYSIGDREAETRLIPAAADSGTAVLTALPLGRSSLFRAVRGKPVPDWAQEFGAATWGQFFLKYLIGNEHVTAVIPGTEKAEHMKDNLGAGRGRLPDAAQRQRMVSFFQSL